MRKIAVLMVAVVISGCQSRPMTQQQSLAMMNAGAMMMNAGQQFNPPPRIVTTTCQPNGSTVTCQSY